VGAINYVLADAGAAKRVLSQNKRIARALYSNPPVHDAPPGLRAHGAGAPEQPRQLPGLSVLVHAVCGRSQAFHRGDCMRWHMSICGSPLTHLVILLMSLLRMPGCPECGCYIVEYM